MSEMSEATPTERRATDTRDKLLSSIEDRAQALNDTAVALAKASTVTRVQRAFISVVLLIVVALSTSGVILGFKLNKVSQGNRKILDRVYECTTPDTACTSQSNGQAAAFLEKMARYQLVIVQCADEFDGSQKIADCVAERARALVGQ